MSANYSPFIAAPCASISLDSLSGPVTNAQPTANSNDACFAFCTQYSTTASTYFATQE